MPAILSKPSASSGYAGKDTCHRSTGKCDASSSQRIHSTISIFNEGNDSYIEKERTDASTEPQRLERVNQINYKPLLKLPSKAQKQGKIIEQDLEKSKDICEKIKKNVGIVLDKPLHPEFSVLSARQRTFKTWPVDCPARPDVLSECGFIYEGTKDRVKCYHCSIVIEEWTEYMDPWETHALKFGFCAHVRQCKGDDFILKIHGDNVTESDCSSNIELCIERNRDAIEAAKSIYCYTDETIRAAVQLIVKRNVSKFSGVDLVNTVEELEQVKTVLTPASELIVQNQHSKFEDLPIDTLMEENERLKSTYLCKVCFEGEANMIILPCGHLCTCVQCISALPSCPICRVHVQGTVRAQYVCK